MGKCLVTSLISYPRPSEDADMIDITCDHLVSRQDPPQTQQTEKQIRSKGPRISFRGDRPPAGEGVVSGGGLAWPVCHRRAEDRGQTTWGLGEDLEMG